MATTETGATKRQPKLRTTCTSCGHRDESSIYEGRLTVVRAWDGNSARDYHTWTCANCGQQIRQGVGR